MTPLGKNKEQEGLLRANLSQQTIEGSYHGWGFVCATVLSEKRQHSYSPTTSASTLKTTWLPMFSGQFYSHSYSLFMYECLVFCWGFLLGFLFVLFSFFHFFFSFSFPQKYLGLRNHNTHNSQNPQIGESLTNCSGAKNLFQLTVLFYQKERETADVFYVRG